MKDAAGVQAEWKVIEDSVDALQATLKGPEFKGNPAAQDVLSDMAQYRKGGKNVPSGRVPSFDLKGNVDNERVEAKLVDDAVNSRGSEAQVSAVKEAIAAEFTRNRDAVMEPSGSRARTAERSVI